MPRTPREALGANVREQVIVEDRVFLLERPGESDKVLDHPAVQQMGLSDDYVPYWADLWPAARMLAKWIVRQSWPTDLHALEIGCGLGLPGLAALAMGLRVTFSDYDATALEYAAGNARLNGFTNFDTLQLDWRYPPEGMRFPLILAADLIYEERNVAIVVSLIKRLLVPEGVCLLTDQDRIPMYAFREVLHREGLPYETQLVRAGEPGGRRLKGTLYQIRSV